MNDGLSSEYLQIERKYVGDVSQPWPAGRPSVTQSSWPIQVMDKHIQFPLMLLL